MHKWKTNINFGIQMTNIYTMSIDLKKTCEQKLQALIPNITPDDKKEVVSLKIVSRPTLDKYLDGEIVKIDTATTLIDFFTNKVKTRLAQLRKTNVA